MKTIVLTNQKGGVGKSAVARLMAHYLVSQGYKTLCLDMDMQANFTYPLRLSNKATIAESGASQVMTIGELDLPKGDLVLVPSDGDLLTDLEKGNHCEMTTQQIFDAFLYNKMRSLMCV